MIGVMGNKTIAKMFTLLRFWPIAVAVVAWEVLAKSGTYNTALLPAPSRILSAWVELAQNGELLEATWGSLLRVSVGFSAALVVAATLAILVSRFRLVEQNVKVIVEFLRPISPIAWIPLAILWFKTGDRPAWCIVFIASFFPLFTNFLLGIHSVSQRHLDVAKSVGASIWLRITDVLLPSAKPAVVTGIRSGLGYAWMSLIAAELIGVREGLGYLVQINRVVVRMDNVLAVMATIGVVGWLMGAVIMWYSSRSMRWWQPTNPLE